ncbi:MAG: HupE/UreJ family protein [Arenicellales bacterium]|nr:HupE/UreJ family protein [Arenicellales bacterium]
MIRFVLWLMLLLVAPPVPAHTLGVDKASLVELTDGSYHLISHVPPRYQSMITTPKLPERCALEGSPRGARGAYEVRFVFMCESPLTASDEIILPWRREGAMMTVTWRDQESVTKFAGKEGGVITLRLEEYLAGSGSFWAGAKRYTLLGIEHILVGVDHLLFVLALLFVVRSGWKLVQTITAFTVAHSITLGLATLGYINMPSAPVEAAIALSIVFLCVEIAHARQGRSGITFSYPWVVAFAFGLLHGLGFAGALSEIGLPPPEIPLALFFFNVGVELGQLIFVFAVLAVVVLLHYGAGISRESKIFLKSERVVVYIIGILASYWLIERGLGVFPTLA